MRIGLDLTPLCSQPSGIATYAENLWRELGRAAGDEVLPCAHRPLLRALSARARPAPNKTAWMQLCLPWQLARQNAEVCHFTNHVASAWTPCPAVVTIHDMSLWLFPEHHYRRRLWSMRPFIRLAARRAASVIAVSRSTAHDVVRLLGVPMGKLHIVPEAAAPIFRPLPQAEVQAVMAAYRLPPRFLLHSGTLEPRKNLVRLLEAFGQVRRQHADVSLVFAGQRGWKDEAILAAIERLGLGGAVRVLGYVPRPALVGLYNAATVCVVPSLHEGFGLPVIEAMACGTPVVTSRRGGLEETAGDAAEYVEPESACSIAHGIQRVLEDTAYRERLRECGQERASQLSWAKTAAQTRAVYEAALRRC
jgi:glycosyltransferase involved in cell wall biosynthesis